MIELYLHIIEGKNVRGVEKNGNSDPFVAVWAPGKKGKSKKIWETRVKKNTRDPKFHSEVVLRLASKSGEVKLQLLDWNAIKSDVLLADELKLDLSTLPDEGSYFESPLVWAGSPCGVLKWFARALPLEKESPTVPAVQPLHRSRLMVERLIYRPGELVRGQLVLNLHKPKTILNFNFGIINAVSKCERAGDPQPARWTQVSSQVQFAPKPDKSINLEPGTHIWSFEVLLPERIQTHTLMYDCSDCQFKVEAYLYMKGSANPEILYIPITIVPAFEKLDPVLPRHIDQSTPSAPFVGTVHWQLSKILFKDKRNVIEARVEAPGVTFKALAIDWCVELFVPRLGKKKQWKLKRTLVTIPIAHVGSGEITKIQAQTDPTNFTIYRNIHFSTTPSPYVEPIEVYNYMLLTGKNHDGQKIELGKAPFFLTHSSLYHEDYSFDHDKRADMKAGKFIVAKVPEGPFGDPNKIFASSGASSSSPASLVDITADQSAMRYNEMRMRLLAPSVTFGAGDLFETPLPYLGRSTEYWLTHPATPLPLGAFDQLECIEANQPFDVGALADVKTFEEGNFPQWSSTLPIKKK
jgi:hypothetical protein